MPGVAELLRMQPLAASFNAHRILVYTLVSTVAVSAAIANALKNHSNFYSVAIYLSKSNRSVLVLANFGLLVALLCGRVVQQIFFGALRPAEVERLYDRLWFFITESLLAFTIFRDDFDIPFALMFSFLLFVKSFHWLASDRIEWMDQRPYPGPPTLFHIRMNALFCILWVIDFVMFALAVESTVTNGVSGMVLFASEYAILMASALNTSAKYLLSVHELRRASQRGGENAPPWENKSMWIFYIELTTDFLKLTTYLVFFTLIITFYGLPLNIVRDVYVTARSFITRLRALQRYQTATRNMDERYPNATEEEMTAMSDRTCIICREEMVLPRPAGAAAEGDAQGPVPVNNGDGPNTTPKKLPCGHIFHFYCLRSWLERQQSCPTCRRTVLERTPSGEGDGAAPGAARPVPGAGAAHPPNGAGPLGAQANPLGGQQQNNGNLPPLPQIPGWGQPGAPNGIMIQYNIQYNPPRQQGQAQPQPLPQPQPQAQPPARPQNLQPVPIFNGFQGAGGDWVPWDMDARLFPGNPPPRAPLPPSLQRIPVPTPATPPTNAAPTPTQTQEQGSTEDPTEQNVTPTSTSTQDEASSNPREAAALAALRRFQGTKSPEPSSSTSTPTQQGSSPSSEIPGPQTVENSDAISPPSVDSSPTISTEGAASTPNGNGHGTANGGDATLKIPTIIPVYDFMRATHPQSPTTTPYGPGAQSPRANGSTPSSAYFRSNYRPRGQATPLGAPIRTASNTQGQRQRSPYNMDYPPQNQAPTARSPRPPLSQLPPTLTDAQLALMDRVTREAIDERLRVLEGVSGAVYRCIEDLMRVRSSLPASGPTPLSASASTSTTTGTAAPSMEDNVTGEAGALVDEPAEYTSKVPETSVSTGVDPSPAATSSSQTNETSQEQAQVADPIPVPPDTL